MLGKERLKSVLFGLEIRSTAIIGNGLVYGVSKQKVLKKVKQELFRTSKYANLSSSETNLLWQENYSRYMRVSKNAFSLIRRAKTRAEIRADTDLDYEEELKIRKNTVYGVLKKEFSLLEREKNQLAQDYEYHAKRDQLQELFGSGVFYLCSSHRKPAKDHADWEGKIYVSEDWESRVDQDMHGRVAEYIRKNDVKTVQWVTGEPVWLVYRPNCKHFLVEVGVEDVLNNSVRALLKHRNMYMEDEKEISYEYGQYKHYYERLKMYSYLREMFDAEELDKDINETKQLVRKWKLLSEGSGYRTNRTYRAITSRETA